VVAAVSFPQQGLLVDIIMVTIVQYLATFIFVLTFHGSFGFSSNNPQPREPAPSGNKQSFIFIPNAEERTSVLLFYKPPNVVTSHVSPDDRSTVYDEVTMNGFVGTSSSGKSFAVSGKGFAETTGIYTKFNSVGRLDADTTGLLLLTNDGGLVHHVTNPSAQTHTKKGAVTKTYEALIMGHHTKETLNMLWEGIDIGAKHGGMTQPVHDLQIINHPKSKTTTVSITISEGKNRQVRRMFHALGSGVMQLKRTHIGDKLNLDGLQEGQWRILTDTEIRKSLDWEPRVLPDPSLPTAANMHAYQAQKRVGSGAPRPASKPRRRTRRS
jgi:pseudouridine synthase